MVSLVLDLILSVEQRPLTWSRAPASLLESIFLLELSMEGTFGPMILLPPSASLMISRLLWEKVRGLPISVNEMLCGSSPSVDVKIVPSSFSLFSFSFISSGWSRQCVSIFCLLFSSSFSKQWFKYWNVEGYENHSLLWCNIRWTLTTAIPDLMMTKLLNYFLSHVILWEDNMCYKWSLHMRVNFLIKLKSRGSLLVSPSKFVILIYLWICSK